MTSKAVIFAVLMASLFVLNVIKKNRKNRRNKTMKGKFEIEGWGYGVLLIVIFIASMIGKVITDWLNTIL